MFGQVVAIYMSYKALTYLYLSSTTNNRQVSWLQKLAEFTLKIVYLLSLKNLVADTLSRWPQEAGQHDDADIGESNSGPYTLQDPVVFGAVED